MSRVDFYILSDATSVDRFACNIAAKAWSQGNRVHIHTQSAQNADTLDNLLWTYRDISFIPHEIFNGDVEDETPVTVGFGNGFPETSEVIINLGNDIPAFINHFDRIVEIVGGNETNKQFARQRYRQYKNSNYEVHDHKIDSLKEHG